VTKIPMSEEEWQGQILDLAHLLGWRHMHARRSIGRGGKWTTATNVTGWPDLTMWHEKQHRVMFVELKTETGKLDPEQIEVLNSLSRAGQEIYVWRPSMFDEIRKVLTS
jgi:hypothetical protein